MKFTYSRGLIEPLVRPPKVAFPLLFQGSIFRNAEQGYLWAAFGVHVTGLAARRVAMVLATGWHPASRGQCRKQLAHDTCHITTPCAKEKARTAFLHTCQNMDTQKQLG